MATVGDGEEGMVTTTTTTTRWMTWARYPGTGMEMRDEETGSVGRGMVTVAQDKEHKKMAQKISSTSLGLQVSFLCSLFCFFLLLTNVLGTSYLQGRQNEEEHSPPGMATARDNEEGGE
jgi:hypothetical protein